jgi:TetR/AcrR family tetracycline transcriptional repressor
VARLNRDKVIAEALDLLDEVGIDALSTRRLAQRLGVEQPALYWHFRNKAALLAAMADTAMTPHGQQLLPEPGDGWSAWFAVNMRSFRDTLLRHRDGARLHAGSRPRSDDHDRLAHKVAFLTAAGLPEADARMGLFVAGRFTVGCVLEQQAEAALDTSMLMPIDHAAGFETGLSLIIAGLGERCVASPRAG